ncbi:hypothetical protein BT69DRAFT_1342906 [Atractiella rhizophila]|nr:hypothetical protein BT69DRAFT_1342906 [Atractiella rhizophila]
MAMTIRYAKNFFQLPGRETAFLFNNQTLLRLRSKGMRLGSFDWDDELQPHMMVNSHQIKTPPREPLAIPISDKCPFKELPCELVERVIGYSTPDSDAFTDNVEEATVEALLKRQGLASLIGTCQSLRVIAQRALYYAPCLRGWSTPYGLGEYSLFLNTIRKNKFLASLVKALRWDHAMGLKEGPQIIFEILQTLEPYNSDERTGLEVVNLTRISAGSGLCILQGITSLVSLKLSGLGRVNKAHEDLYFPPFSNFLARMIYLKDLALEGFAHSFSLFADGAFTEGPCAFELTSFSAVNVEWRKSSVQQLLQSSAQSLKVLELKNIKGTETFDVLGELLGQRSLDVVRFVGYIPRSQFRHFIVPTANRAKKVSMEIETTEDAEAHTVESIPTTPNSLYYMLKDYWKPTSIYRQVEFIFPGTKHAELTLQAVDNLFAMVKGGENLERLSIWMFDDGSDLAFAEHLDPRIVVQSFSQTSEIYTSWPCWT